MSTQTWSTPLGRMSLPEHEVHVWRARLDVPARDIPALQWALSAEENARAARFYFERDRSRWIVARGLLRKLLGYYTRTDPRLINFELNRYGKPALAFPTPHAALQFNVSHSADLALYAFTWRRPLGVDVEYMRPDIEYDQIARHSFSPGEQRTFAGLSLEEKHEAFYRCWTRKEAYIKARGIGLSLSLDLFDVSLLPGEPAALLCSREDPQEAQRWSMRQLDPGPGYAGALVVEGTDWHLQCYDI